MKHDDLFCHYKWKRIINPMLYPSHQNYMLVITRASACRCKGIRFVIARVSQLVIARVSACNCEGLSACHCEGLSACHCEGIRFVIARVSACHCEGIRFVIARVSAL
ncbi:MAG: hypothetical protein HS127_07205 [Planctomycetia bacterium]|uniref:hypothetical protein n=1 Tax=Candidatus Kuenenia sp. TaxID=2499824 RepID=UPI001D1B1C3C|nr:hypothetical protein [Planctomycetia bacterium]